jgi:hypothetical protein
MIQKKHFAGGLLGLVISITLQTTSAATEAPATSWLMSEAELAAHRATMATLEGQAREDYRNAQYEQLKRRALERGFSLPADPPWAKMAASPGPANPATAANVTETDAAARHAEMRDKLQARREALQKDSEANLERLQQATNAQQQQVEAQLQDIDKEATGRESAAELPSAPTPLAAPVTSMPEPTPGPETLTATPPVETRAPLASPAPTAPPTPPASANVGDMGQAPRFAPIEQAAPVMPSPDIPLPDIPLPDISIPETPSPVMPPPEQDTASGEWQTELGSVTPPYGDADAMTAYRNSMRTRFDEYMKERQAQMEEKARRQREKLEAAMEQNRSMRAGRPPHPHYPYPAAPPSYGPRYPAAYPGYRTPYWQQ